MYILNPDKYALPWRSYCALSPPFSAAEVNKFPPVGIFVGVMSTDSAVERRMLIRSTWAKHVRSRGTDGGTDRAIVRFILGIPSHDWMRRIQLESESKPRPHPEGSIEDTDDACLFVSVQGYCFITCNREHEQWENSCIHRMGSRECVRATSRFLA